jgi:hypothetical protein
MRVRIREEVDGSWTVETKTWNPLYWEFQRNFGSYGELSGYELAKAYAKKLKTLRIEEIK